MKKLFATILALSALAALTGPVYAQLQGRERMKTPLQIEEEQKKKEAEKASKEYEAAMKKTQGQESAPAAIDPWANMRSVDGSQPKH